MVFLVARTPAFDPWSQNHAVGPNDLLGARVDPNQSTAEVKPELIRVRNHGHRWPRAPMALRWLAIPASAHTPCSKQKLILGATPVLHAARNLSKMALNQNGYGFPCSHRHTCFYAFKFIVIVFSCRHHLHLLSLLFVAAFSKPLTQHSKVAFLRQPLCQLPHCTAFL